MKKMFVLPILLLSTIHLSAHAVYTGTVKQVVCHATGVSPVCHISVNGTPSQPACVTSGWHYTFDGTTPEGKNLLSILLAAQLSRSNITIGGKGTCSLIGGSEDVQHVYITTTN